MEKKSIFRNNKGVIFGAVMVACIMLGVVVGSYGDLFSYQTIKDVEVSDVNSEREWGWITGDYDFSGDESGFCYGMAYPHSADPANDYAVNLSNATAYEFSDSLDAEMTGETPFDTTADFVIKYRLNDTVAYDIVNGTWRHDWIRAYMDADFSSAADFNNVEMTLVNISANDDFIWFHMYIQDIDGGAGDGFTITHNEDYTVFPLLEGYW